jgi:hypothetical protein
MTRRPLPSHPVPPTPAGLTAAIRQALTADDAASAADLIFLESWERRPTLGADARRFTQIRRANPALVDAIRAEIAAEQQAASGLGAEAS